jgi:hypothetical protein
MVPVDSIESLHSGHLLIKPRKALLDMVLVYTESSSYALRTECHYKQHDHRASRSARTNPANDDFNFGARCVCIRSSTSCRDGFSSDLPISRKM